MRQLVQRFMAKLAYRRPTSFGRGTLLVNGYPTTEYATVVYDPVRKTLDITTEPYSRAPSLVPALTPLPTIGVELSLSRP